MPSRITGVVLTHNEEHNILGCLAHLRPHVDEIILVDTESTDRTVELARPLVDKVLMHPHVPNFDSARNLAFPEAKHDWLWFVDADEQIPQKTGDIVNRLICEQGETFEAINIPFKSYFCGQWMQHCGWWPGYTCPRVLKRGHFRFAEKLHGGVEGNGRQIAFASDPSLGVDHYSYRSIEHYLEKANRYTSTEARQFAQQGQTWDWRAAMRAMTRELWLSYERNRGDLDGDRGWILSWLGSQYRWLSQAKLIDESKPDPATSSSLSIPANLDEVITEIQLELSRLRAPQPKLPLGVVWRSPLWDASGYAEESRQFVKALAAGDRAFAVEEMRWNDQIAELPTTTRSLLRAASQSRRPTYNLAITNCISTLAEPDPLASLNILRTTFETDRIPTHWHTHLNAFDEIWVISRHNERAFRRSGVPPEKLRVVPSFVDASIYSPEGMKARLPEPLQHRFVFLSVFDWQLRKGWDVLLRAYVKAFSAQDGIGLYLKITRAHGISLELVREQIETVLQARGTSLAARPDIVLDDTPLAELEMAALYRSAQAFVLSSRGEGWGRPYMEAMASGLPTIGTHGSGNLDFMHHGNSYLIPAALVDVPPEAVAEIPVYQGQQWYEPDEEPLRAILQRVVENEEERTQRAGQALTDIRENFGLAAGTQYLECAIAAAEARFQPVSMPVPRPDQMRVAWEGEFFAGHSFSHINEQLTNLLMQDEGLALTAHKLPSLAQNTPQPHLQPLFGRVLPGPPQVTVRHAYPPNWQKPTSGRWIHIQPWEYGPLPTSWIQPLRDEVDEIWVPSHYVRQMYLESGLPAEKIQVIPWGVDPKLFQPSVPPLFLPTQKSFRFLFVGGTIPRKGIDLLLQAYTEEFSPEDDVALVIKDSGADTFYRGGNARERIRKIVADTSRPEIVYLDRHFTTGQLASLYTACNCLAAPYHGEGFGLPILEAMACGLPAIVPQGGPSDDFTREDTALRLPSQRVPTTHVIQLCGEPYQLSINVQDLRAALRKAFEQRDRIREMGLAASADVHQRFTWQQTAALMAERICHVARQPSGQKVSTQPPAPQLARTAQSAERPLLAALVSLRGHESSLGECLARVRPFVQELVVDGDDPSDRSWAVAQEYGARLLEPPDEIAGANRLQADWVLCLEDNHYLPESEMLQLAQRLRSEPAETLVVSLPDVSRAARDKAMKRETVLVYRNQRYWSWTREARGQREQQLASPPPSPNGHANGDSAAPIRANGKAPLLPPMLEPWLIPYVRTKGEVFLDIGANVGTWTYWLAAGFKQVHAIEPNPDALPELKRNLPANVTVHEFGAWDQETILTFNRFSQSVHLTAYFQEEGINTGPKRDEVELPCRPIDTIPLNGRVDFVKCDTEGAEVNCLLGARGTIARDRPWLLVECHSSDNFSALSQLLSEWRYLFTVVRDPHYEPFSKNWYEHCWFACQPRND